MAEYNSAGTLLRRYVHGPAAGADDPLIWYEGGALRMLYADARGSIALVRDSSNVTNALNTYDEYGIPGSANAGRFQYTGQIWLPALGMYYYKARMYSPTLGRFMQTDPIGYDDGLNIYAYVGNDPVNNVDPTGMVGGCMTCVPIGGVWGNQVQSIGNDTANASPNDSRPRTKPGQAKAGGFVEPTNPPSEPPVGETKPATRGGGRVGVGPNGETIRIQPKGTGAQGYPNGYWVPETGGNKIDPRTGKPPPASEFPTPGERAAQTHVPLPENSRFNRPPEPTSRGLLQARNLRLINPLYLICYAIGICNPSPLN